MGSHEQAVMGLESRAVSVWVNKLIVTIFSKMCNKYHYQMIHICKQANAWWEICCLLIFLKIIIFKKSFRNTIRVQNTLNPDQAQTVCKDNQQTTLAGRELT